MALPDDPPELVAQVRELYEAGNTMQQTADLLGLPNHGTVDRIMRRNGIKARPPHRIDTDARYMPPRGADHHSWKGGDRRGEGYSGGHGLVQRKRGTPSECSECGRTDDQVDYQWANLTGDFRNIWDYRRMCRPCHIAFDKKRRAEQ